MSDIKRMEDLVEERIFLHKQLNSPLIEENQNINEKYEVFFSKNEDISNQTRNKFIHQDGNFYLHDGFLKVSSERKKGGKYHSSLSGYGFVYGEDRELGRALVNIEFISTKPVREINGKEIFSFDFLNYTLGIVYHKDGTLKSLVTQVDDLQITLGPTIKFKREAPQEYPAKIVISIRDWQNNNEVGKAPRKQVELDAIWSSDRLAYVLEDNKKIQWSDYDLSKFGFIERCDIYLREDPTFKSKLKQDNDDDFFNTNGSIKTFIKQKNSSTKTIKKSMK